MLHITSLFLESPYTHINMQPVKYAVILLIQASIHATKINYYTRVVIYLQNVFIIITTRV